MIPWTEILRPVGATPSPGPVWVPSSVMRMVLAHGRRLTLVGIALGIAGSLAVSRLMQQALFDVSPADPFVYLALSVTLLLVAEFAAWLPARRATRIDPVIALRTE